MYVIVDQSQKKIIRSWSNLEESEESAAFIGTQLDKLSTRMPGRSLRAFPVRNAAELEIYQEEVWFWLFNYTPHVINLINVNGVGGTEQDPLPIESSGVARAEELVEELTPIRHDYFGDSGMHVDVPLVLKRYGAVTGLPGPQPHTLYIVSNVVQLACPDRRDLVAPHDLVRDASGRIIGCRGFSRQA